MVNYPDGRKAAASVQARESAAHRGMELEAEINQTNQYYLQQDLAAQRLLQFDDGILSAATAFGKTAVCSYLISRRKVSTLVLLRSKALMNQWLEEFSILPWWIHYAGRKIFRICSKHMGWSLWTNVIMELPQVRRRY